MKKIGKARRAHLMAMCDVVRIKYAMSRAPIVLPIVISNAIRIVYQGGSGSVDLGSRWEMAT